MLEGPTGPATAPDSHWWREPFPDFPALAEDVDADVVIIGGGVTGITLAYTLADEGASVVLLESGVLAGSASGRNAGFMLAAPAEPYGEAIALWGRTGARAILESGRRTHARVRTLIETLGLECDYRQGGSMRLTRSEEETEDQRAALPLLHADGFPMREIPVASAVPGEAATRFHAAFLTSEDGEFHPVRFLHGVARAAAGLGARLYAHSPVASAHWSAGVWQVSTGASMARARVLVLATNAYAPSLCPALAPLIAPRRGQMLMTAPVPRSVSAYPTYSHWGYRYWRQTPDGRVLIGGWRDVDPDGETGFDDLPTPRIQRGIEEGLAELVPEGVEIERRWAGTMGFARDGRPLVGWLDAEHHLAIAAGYTGHGMSMAPACTLDLTQLLSFRPAPGIATYDPARFPELRRPEPALTRLGAAAH
ncbi:MAG TPA: FAD-dependent oxidoreductase [Candidatus Udaeobacter sp.]|jgi:gamma-glutamylputrescine oxidase|nr:FAD-dependent oxidoreductase [Candidatus Udaeobacter sp.]